MSEQTRPTAGVWTQSEVDAAEFTAAQPTDQYSGRLGLNHEMNSNYSNSMTHIHPATRYQQLTGNYIVSGKNAWKGLGAHDRFVPLNFWFCRNPGLALPIIALQYHEVVVNWTLPDINEISINGTDASKIFQDFSDHSNDSLITNPRFNNVKLLVDYVYLDTDERRRFAQVSHEYLIEQLQFQEIPSESTIPLHFNHPVKELIWTAVPVCSPFFDFGGANATARLHGIGN